MATRQDRGSLRAATPIVLFYQFTGDGDLEPKLNSESDVVTNAVFESYGVDSVEELVRQELGQLTRPDKLRLGVYRDTADGGEFILEQDLLTRVEGISDDLATGLLDECNDIPTVCERRRGSGDVFLGDLRHDAEVQGHDWVPELEAFIEALGEWDNLESRLKDAGVWVEPQNEIAA